MDASCPICRDYEIQLNRAAEREDDDCYGAVYSLYEAHLIEAHQHPRMHTQKQPLTKVQVREIFGRIGE